MPREIASLPKVELHVHLEGTVSAATALDLARRHGVDQESLGLVNGSYPNPFSDFQQFVDVYLVVSGLIREPEDLREVAAAFARGQTAQNILYTEVTFTALTHVRNGMDPAAMWAAVRDGFAEAGPNSEIKLIVDAVRNFGVKHAAETVELVEAADAPIVGLGLAGIEGSAPEGDFKVLREAADAMGLGLAVHAGETGEPANVEAALDDLGADRIGHGVAAARDETLLKRLAHDQVPVEVCPSSNVVLGIFPSLEAHPFPQLYEFGVNVTVNSDDPPFFGTTLTQELEHAAKLARLGPPGLAELQRRAARAAFAPDDTKQRLLAAIDAWISS